jgi:hypothetical protein
MQFTNFFDFIGLEGIPKMAVRSDLKVPYSSRFEMYLLLFIFSIHTLQRSGGIVSRTLAEWSKER